jgi:hypothetical protein
MVIKKHEMIPRDESAEAPFFQTLAGGNIRDAETGVRMLTHEYDHKSFHNMVYALCQRQFGCLTEPNDDHLEAFGWMVNKWMDSWVPAFKQVWTPKCMFEYVENQASFSREKKLKYISGLTRMLTDRRYNNFVGHFCPMVKSGEVYANTEEQSLPESGFHNKTSDRPRCICPPTPSGVGPMQAFQASIFPALKQVMPEFIHSMTSKQIVSSVAVRIKQDWKAISIDGSSFDSSQYAILQETVENEFFRRIEDEIHSWCYY